MVPTKVETPSVPIQCGFSQLWIDLEIRSKLTSCPSLKCLPNAKIDCCQENSLLQGFKKLKSLHQHLAYIGPRKNGRVGDRHCILTLFKSCRKSPSTSGD